MTTKEATRSNTEVRHTPGPWKCSGVGAIIGANGEYVAAIQTLTDMLANARLIAAAPDLLEALKHLADVARRSLEAEGEVFEYERLAIEQAEAVIAKATSP